jgi:LuxR family maltose regulon positive regulatory protein
LAHAAASWARLALSLGDLATATRWLTSLEESGDDRSTTLPPIKEYEDLTRVAVYLALNRSAEALALLARLRPPAETAGRFDHVYRMMAFQALALEAAGDTAGALDTLKELLSLTAPEGYIRLFADLGWPMLRLLGQAADAGIEPPAVRRILMAFNVDDETPAPALLSDREKEVLVLIAVGRSNREIAEALVIAVGTVKRHNNNIYRKLDVSSRTQAVDKARALGLLP